MRVNVKEQKTSMEKGTWVLKPFVGTMRMFHRLAAFPINAEFDSSSSKPRFSLDKSTYILYFIFSMSAVLCFTVEYILFFTNGISLQGLFDLITDQGLALTDVYACQLLYFSCFGCNVILGYFFRGLDQKLTEFDLNISSMESSTISSEECIKLFKKKAVKGSLMFVMVFTAATMTTAAMGFSYQPGLGSGPLLWIMLALQMFATFIVFCPPVNMFIHTLTTYSLEAINVTLVKYSEKVKLAKTEGVKDMSEILKVGFRLEEMVEHANGMLAGLILIEYTTTSIIQIGCMYFSVGLLEAFVAQSFKPGAMLFASQAVLSTVVSAMLRIDLALTGDNISAAYRSIKRSLQDVLKRYRQDLNQNIKLDAEMLMERFTNEAPISPFGSFSVNASSSISLDATIITYIIVLLQFRLSG